MSVIYKTGYIFAGIIVLQLRHEGTMHVLATPATY